MTDSFSDKRKPGSSNRPLSRRPVREDVPDELEEITDEPSPGRVRRPRLNDDADDLEYTRSGSRRTKLGQDTHTEQLNSARIILIIVGLLTIGVNLFDLVVYLNNTTIIKTPTMTLIAFFIDGLAIAVGVVFLLLALLLKRFPVPTTIMSLVLYVASTIGFFLLTMVATGGSVEALLPHFSGWFWKIAIVVALSKAIGSAIAYEREKRDSEFDDLEEV